MRPETWKDKGVCLLAAAIPLNLALTYAVALPLMAYWLYREGRRLPALLRQSSVVYTPLAFFFLNGALASVVGLDPVGSLYHLGRLLFMSLIIVCAFDCLRRENLGVVGLCLLLGQFLAAWHSILSYFWPELPRLIFIGTVTESGQLTLSVFFAAAVAWYYLTEESSSARSKIVPLIWLLVLPSLLAALLVNLKRGPWFGVLIGVLLLLLLQRRLWLLPLLAMVLLLVFTVPPLRDRWEQSYDHFKIAGGRSSIWQVGVELAARYPLGIGFRNSPILNRFDPYIPDNLTHFHSNYLNILVELGWLGLAIFLWLLFRILSMAFTLAPPGRRSGQALGCGLLAWMLAGAVEYNFGDSEVRQLLLFIWAWLLRLAAQNAAVDNSRSACSQ